MTFTTLTFAIFLPLVFVLYWLLRKRASQNILLVAASYLFYGWWDYRFCALMFASSMVDYAVGWWLGRTDSPRARRYLLAASIVSNLGLLGVFKYFHFFTDNLRLLAEAIGWRMDPLTIQVILPVGISFYTFQTLSYTIDIYRRQLQPTRNLIDYLAFVSFFPQLVAGPIERASRLLPQFAQARVFDCGQARDACRLILWGLFKKIAVADRLAVVVQQRYDQPEALGGPELALATICFAFQIYCDFSAYSDMAIGTAKLFNIDLMRNFAYPYFSQSVTEFWRRWHISLSTWFRDYVFIPLGGSRGSRLRCCVNVLVTFLVSGFWHGAAWRFLLWGGVNGVATIGSNGGKPASDTPGGQRLIPTPRTTLKMVCTFTIICVGWVFFRAESMADAVLILRKIAADALSWPQYAALAELVDGDGFLRKTLAVLLVFVLVEWLQRRHACPLHLAHWPVALRWGVYTLVFWSALDLMPPAGGQQFIYFDF